MNYFTRRYLFLNLIISVSLSTYCYSSSSAIATNKTKSQDKRTIRVTTGIEQVSGWEQGLVKANPNLARWHWDPIYSYKQGYATVTPEPAKAGVWRSAKTPGRIPATPSYNYNIPAPQDSRPKHIPFSSRALEEVSARYKEPDKSILPMARPINEQNVYGQLSNQNTEAKLIPPTVATYGQPYKSQEKTSLQYNSQKTSVYGQLLDQKQKPSNSRTALKRKKIK